MPERQVRGGGADASTPFGAAAAAAAAARRT